jgi:hypothetical protein
VRVEGERGGVLADLEGIDPPWETTDILAMAQEIAPVEVWTPTYTQYARQRTVAASRPGGRAREPGHLSSPSTKKKHRPWQHQAPRRSA